MSMTSTSPVTVSELTREIRDMLQANFDNVACVGEVSNLIRARSGHLYFTLKDDKAQISAVMWKSRAERLKFDLQDGLEIVVMGPIEVYPPRGSYQLIVEQAFPQGIGPLELAFRQLQEKLAAEGLFDTDRKKPLPRFPRKIALVTSPTGAAVRDMLQVLTKRWSLAEIIVVPVPVQGATAAPQIARGIELAGRIPELDLIITGRGGGSLEDLWPFNEEVVARAIAASRIPIISAVGHEIDVSIADLVADRRALTPTEAAEMSVPDQSELLSFLSETRGRLRQLLINQARQARFVIESLANRRLFTRPEELFSDVRRRLDELDQQLNRRMRDRCEQNQSRLQHITSQLEALSPLRVLARGYSLTRDAETGATLRSADQIEVGQTVKTRLASGEITCEVKQREIANS